MSDVTAARIGLRSLLAGFGMGAVLALWNMVGMYTNIAVDTWDLWRQVLFVSVLCGTGGLVGHVARSCRRWLLTCASAILLAVGCATTVVGAYALSTRFGAERILQVPEFIRDYTHHGYTSPAAYFADNYWPLLQLQFFTWVIGAGMLVAVGLVLGTAIDRSVGRAV
jgi:hypothetical protein